MQEYKESGIEWIGKIPKNWNVTYNKYIMTKIKKIVPKYKNEDILSLTMNGVIVRDEDDNTGKRPLTYDGYQKVNKGNLLMCLFDIDVTPRCVGYINNDGITSPAYSQFKMEHYNSAKYYYYYYLMLDQSKELLHLAKNLRHSLTEFDFGAIPVIVPPLNEQVQIAEYIECEYKKIDLILNNVKKQIEILNKYKRSLITEKITKGLNNNTEMKESGIDWIGKIPKKWNIKRITNISSLKGRIGWQGLTTEEYIDEGPFLITGVDFNNGTIEWNNCVHVSEWRFKQAPEIQIKDGDLLITKDGTVGKVAITKNTPSKVTLNSGVLLIRPMKEKIYINKFIYYVILSNEFWHWFDYINSGNTTIIHLYQNVFAKFTFAIPDINEQKEIVNYLDQKCKKIDEIINIKQKQIEKLENYKKSLIYE